MSMSIRLRLTVLYSAILAGTLIAFSLALYLIQARYTLSFQRQDLISQARRLALGVARAYTFRDRRGLRPGAPPPGPPGPLGEQELQELRSRDLVRVLDTDGSRLDLALDQDTERLPLGEKGRQAILSGHVWVEIASVEGERLLIYNQPVRVEEEIVGIVQVARSLVDRDRSLRALGVALLVGSLLTTLAAFGVGWALSGITLKPIERMTQTAQAIGAERDLSRRIEYAGPHDEVGQLAATLNGMLAELQDAYQQVEKALDMQRTFVADVSHELRTPLTTLRGNLALLCRQPPIRPQERQDILDDMVDENERLIRLVNDLLALARAEAGQQLLSERVPISPLIRELCRQARLLDPDREIACEPTPDLIVIADRGALKQVILILLDNAIQHAEGTITVTVQAVPGSTNPYAAISVQDSGPGIVPDVRSRLFERFAPSSTASGNPGLGVGLPIAKALIEAQNGTLTVESQAGQGSTFTITLPMHRTYDDRRALSSS
jgi:two-component system OmpR family sensor kinase